MSYILDALRRADAERERDGGAVPTLHAQARPWPGHDDSDEAPGRRRPAWLLPGLGALVVAAAAGAWWAGSRGAATETAARGLPPTPMPVQAAPVSAAPPPAAVPATVMPPTASTPPMVVPPMPTTSSTSTKAAPPIPRALPVPAPAPAQAAAAAPRAPAQPPARQAAPPAPNPAAAASAASARIPRQAELPDAVRREIPAMAISGSIYSPERRARMVIINGQVRREGEAIAAGLVIEEIRAKTAILVYKGQRFEVLL